MIFKVLSEEENKFNKTIDTGLNILADMEEEMKKNNQTQLSGENAFKLYDTYGFPLDLTEEILEEKGFGVDEDGFKEAMEVQRKKQEVHVRRLTIWVQMLLYMNSWTKLLQLSL